MCQTSLFYKIKKYCNFFIVLFYKSIKIETNSMKKILKT